MNVLSARRWFPEIPSNVLLTRCMKIRQHDSRLHGRAHIETGREEVHDAGDHNHLEAQMSKSHSLDDAVDSGRHSRLMCKVRVAAVSRPAPLLRLDEGLEDLVDGANAMVLPE